MFLFTGKRKSRPGCPVVLPLPPPPEPPVEPTPPPTKILLLGTFESGKSTIRIQTRLLFGHVFSTKEKIKIKVFIIRNIIENMRQMLRATQTLHLDMSTEENRQRKEKILAMHPRVLLNPKDDIWNETLVQDLEELLKDPAILQVLARRNEFIIHDCATYFFDHLHRIANKDYVPSDEDLIRVRIKSIGVIERRFFTFNNESFSLVECAGARCERKKWPPFVAESEYIIYCCSLSEFDQPCYEDDTLNRMKESVSAFEHLLSNMLTPTQQPHVYLIFTKLDLFEIKIKNGSRLADTFDEYKGPEKDPLAAIDFITEMYLEKDVLKRVKDVFYLNALDSISVRQTIQPILKRIIKKK